MVKPRQIDAKQRASNEDLTRLEASHLHEVDDLRPAPTKASGVILSGCALLVLTFFGFGGWAAMAPLNSAATAQGTIVVQSSRRDVQHLDGGIVAEILVRDGDMVKVGDVLLRLDPVRAAAQLGIVRSQLDAALVLQARLRAEQEGLSSIPLAGGVASRAAEPAVAEAIASQQQVFVARRSALEGQILILRRRIAQFREQMIGLTAQGEARGRQISLINRELTGVRSLAAQGYAPMVRVLALEREIARLDGERGEQLAAVARTEQAIGEAELQILQLTHSFREEVAGTLQTTQNQIFELQERLTATEDTMRRLELTAPSDGVVVGLAVFTVGGVITPGRTVMQIVPDQDTLVVEAQLNPTDIERVQVGQAAVVSFPALVQRTIPTLTGTVIQVSADRLVDERTGAPFFKSRILLDASSQELLGDRRLLPGMPADVMIATGERTALVYLTNPIIQAARHAMRER
jgi:HlyD family secretion protein/epimerase transport system membrane fusion protein